MQINVKVTPASKRNEVIAAPDGWKVYLTAPANEGKANKALIKILSEYLDVAPSRIEITKGLKSRQKIVMIE